MSSDNENDKNVNSDHQEQPYCSSSHSSHKLCPPITLLQEICSRNGFTPEYQLLSTEGSVHEPTFKIAVTVDDITVTASGQSKKKARHAAAKEAIEKLRGRTNLNFEGINFESMTSIGEPSDGKSVYETASNEANPVGKLQEICMKMRVNPPDYDTVNERGLAHERIFYLSCTITKLDITTCGEGRSKKLAKRQAAEKMLARLDESDIYDQSANSKATEAGAGSINMDSDDNSHFVRSRGQVTEAVRQLECNVPDLRRDLEMIETDNVNDDLFYDLLQEVVSSIGRLRFDFLNDKQCILHVRDSEDNIVLPLTSWGSGENNTSAMRSAAKTFYQIMMTYNNPLTGKESHQHHQAVGSANLLDL